MADEMPLSDDARQAGFGFASYLLVLSLIDKLVQTNRLSRQGGRPHTPDIGPDPDWEEFAPDSALERDGFELSVPGRAIRPFGRGEDVFQ
jgi:hypothetical protein